MSETEQPECIGFIMDGNRRWAKEQEIDPLLGHEKGYEAFSEVVTYLKERGIPHGIFYAFSTENWNRTETEVSYLMGLFKRMLQKMLSEKGEGVSIKFIGEISRFDGVLRRLIRDVEKRTEQKEGATIWIALSYGGRAEILDAVNRAVRAGKKVNEESFQELLWTRGMPDPDLIIRTSGEQRLSNFLPWQSVYSEFFFTKTYWPDFGKAELESILEEYANRKRRKGV